MRKSTVLTLLALIAPCLAYIPRDAWSKNTIDFRYPNYIVDPRPDCPSEGVFPHPRNCSWYYRCHAPVKAGFYHTFYFECEPGTVFSDELDQCIHPFNPDYPCKTAPKPPIVPPPACYESLLRCKFYMCHQQSGGWASIGRLCKFAVFSCSDGSRRDICRSSQYYDVLRKKCVQQPDPYKCVDKDTYESTSTTTTTEAPTKAPSKDECYDSLVECRNYKCPESTDKEYLCKKAFKTCFQNKLSFYCTSQYYYNYDTKQCVDPPSERGCIDLEAETSNTTDATPPAPVTIDPSSLTFSFTVECSVAQQIPRHAQLEDYFCSEYPSCQKSGSATVRLCRRFLHCSHVNDNWKAVMTKCPGDLLYSYERDGCYAKPEC